MASAGVFICIRPLYNVDSLDDKVCTCSCAEMTIMMMNKRRDVGQRKMFHLMTLMTLELQTLLQLPLEAFQIVSVKICSVISFSLHQDHLTQVGIHHFLDICTGCVISIS